MGSVAPGAIFCFFTSAQGNNFCFFTHPFDTRKTSPLVGTVAKGLLCTQAARAPEIGFTFFKLDTVRAVLGTFRLIHGMVPLYQWDALR